MFGEGEYFKHFRVNFLTILGASEHLSGFFSNKKKYKIYLQGDPPNLFVPQILFLQEITNKPFVI
jgi:hypothetical protein